jgi:regulator of sirC expression with transglutaminase-like and TPR domain
MNASIAADLRRVLAEDPPDLIRGALTIARLEYPNLDFRTSIATLERIGRRAAARLGVLAEAPLRARIAALNDIVFGEERFAGNHAQYDDFRNSCLNVVLDRRLGIPITLALVYIEVARRAGLRVLGVGFPSHFLLRVPAADHPGETRDLILDPFDRGAEVDEDGCRALLARHLGTFEDEVPLSAAMLAPCPPRHLLVRMLNNLKRAYVDGRSFSHARRVSDLLLAIDPTLLSEVRDRGLLSYRLDDYPAALRDLESYLRLSPKVVDQPSHGEWKKLWKHVKALRLRVASLN